MDLFLKLLLAILLGSLVGLERTIARKRAGMRTYALVGMGSCLFILVAEQMRPLFLAYPGFNPILMASQIVVGIGFIGAGLIIFQRHTLQGLTSAAGLWVTAGIGIAVGYGLYFLAILAAILTLVVFTVFWWVEQKITPVFDQDDSKE